MRLSFVCLLGAAAGLFVETVGATVLRVPGDFPTIQSAVDAASDGDEIQLGDGDYSGAGNTLVLVDHKSLVLRSENGPDFTRVVGEGPDGQVWGLQIRSAPDDVVAIRGLGFQSLGGAFGSAVLAFGSGRLEVEDCSFTDCGSPPTSGGQYGGAMRIADSVGAGVRECQFALNHAAAGGSAIAVSTSSAVRIEQTTFWGNEVDALRIKEPATGVEIVDCHFALGSRAITSGPGAHVDVTGTTIVSCGLTVVYSATLRNTTIANNYVASLFGPGGALQIMSGPVLLENCIVRNNCTVTGVTDLVAYGPTTVVCCAVDSAGIAGWEHLSFEGDQVWEDPQFCDPEECEFGRDGNRERYYLESSSPCAAWLSPCGATVGALDIGCGGPAGACCVGAACLVMPPGECEQSGGSYLGDGTPCDAGTCDPVPVIRRSWGGVKRMFR